jgi:5'-methylthioadenosine phosphorylase
MSVAEIGIIGGSGVYHYFSGGRELTVQTPYGAISDVITIGEIAGKRCAFIPRHGGRHSLPPHRIPSRANLYALKELGVLQVIATAASGALDPACAVGSFVIADQLIDMTRGCREDTFYDGPITTHISFEQPYCPQMREAALKAALKLGLAHCDGGTVVVTAGPRFSTLAESRYFAAQGWQLENMTQYPEAALARELTLSYLCIGLVTNSHSEAEDQPAAAVNAGGVMQVLHDKLPQLKQLIDETIAFLPPGSERPEFIREALQRGRWI